MPSLDTNVLVRYLVADDRGQYEMARTFIEEAVHDESLFIPLSVAVELEWVLRSLYEADKSTILTTFNRLLETREIEFHEESSIEICLSLYAESNADFADCLHVASAYSNERVPLITFDRKASRLVNAQLLE